MDVRHHLRNCLALVCLLGLTCTAARAQEGPACGAGPVPALRLSADGPGTGGLLAGPGDCPPARDACESLTDRYRQWRTSLQVMAGAFASPLGMGPHPRRDFDYAPVECRFGCMLCDPWPEGWPVRANLEGLLDVTTAPVLKGPGNYFAGPSLLLRSNFVCPDARLVPYIQVGAGIAFNDGYHDQTQRLLGRAQEFYLTGMAGVHYQFNPCWSLDVEGGYGHISNADTAARNNGVNALGGTMGLTYTFGARHQ